MPPRPHPDICHERPLPGQGCWEQGRRREGPEAAAHLLSAGTKGRISACGRNVRAFLSVPPALGTTWGSAVSQQVTPSSGPLSPSSSLLINHLCDRFDLLCLQTCVPGTEASRSVRKNEISPTVLPFLQRTSRPERLPPSSLMREPVYFSDGQRPPSTDCACQAGGACGPAPAPDDETQALGCAGICHEPPRSTAREAGCDS